MPDISMCAATACAFSKTCRRHANSGTVPNPLRQSCAAFQPDAEGQGCDAYWHVPNPSDQRSDKEVC